MAASDNKSSDSQKKRRKSNTSTKGTSSATKTSKPEKSTPRKKPSAGKKTEPKKNSDTSTTTRNEPQVPNGAVAKQYRGAVQSQPQTLQSQGSFERDSDAYLKKVRREQGYMPIGEHLEELRWRLMRSVIWVAVFSVIGAFFYEYLWNFVMGPIVPLIEHARQDNLVVKMITNKMTDFFMIYVKIVILSGLIFALPAILFEIWGFIVPALDKALKRWGYALLIFAILLFAGGVTLARVFIWPLVTHFLIYDWIPPGLPVEFGPAGAGLLPEVHLTIGDYLSFFFGFHIAFGSAFELPVVSMILAFMGVLHTGFFFKSWRVAILVIAIASALITPPDVISMLALMAPLILLFIFSGFLVFLIDRKSRQ